MPNARQRLDPVDGADKATIPQEHERPRKEKAEDEDEASKENDAADDSSQDFHVVLCLLLLKLRRGLLPAPEGKLACGQSGFRFRNIFRLHDDTRGTEFLDVADFDGDNDGLEGVPFGLFVEPRLERFFTHNVAVGHLIDVLAPVRVVLKIELAIVGRVFVHDEGQGLVVSGLEMHVPDFAVGVLHVFDFHAELFGNTVANGRVVVRIDEATLAADFLHALVRATRTQLRLRFRNHAHESALRAVGLDEANHFKVAAD